MIKKFFAVLLVVIVLAALYKMFKKQSPSVETLFNPAKNSQGQNSLSVSPTISTTSISPATGAKAIFLDISQPANNSTLSSSSVVVSGKTLPNASVTIDDQDFKADANGNFSTNVALLEGPNNIYVIVNDDAGNNAEKDLVVNLTSTQ